MELIDVNYSEYSNIFHKTYHIFNNPKFIFLNKFKCEQVKYLLFKDSKYRLGLIGGITNKKFQSPFSSPFGGFSFIKSSLQIASIEGSIDALENYCKINEITEIEFILPPLFYDEIFLSKLINVLFRKSYLISKIELDFYFKLEQLNDKYLESIWSIAKKNLVTALKSNIEFTLCSSCEDKEIVYQIIKENRLLKNRPLYMSLEQIIDTSNIIETDFFLLKYQGNSICSAVVYCMNEEIVYIPFVGDKPGFSELRPMNLLFYKIFEYYSLKGFKIVHLGISTENSVPNYGLCEFKESFGCSLAPRFSFVKKLNNSVQIESNSIKKDIL